MRPMVGAALILVPVAVTAGVHQLTRDGPRGEVLAEEALQLPGSMSDGPSAPLGGGMGESAGSLGLPDSVPGVQRQPLERSSRDVIQIFLSGEEARAPRRGTEAVPGHYVGLVDEPLVPLEAWSLVDSLRDDDVRHNATNAVWQFRRHIHGNPPERWAIRHALEPHLDQEDLQLRTIAGALLMTLDRLEHEGGRSSTPSPALQALAVEWMVKTPRLDSYMGNMPSRYDIVAFAMNHVGLLESRLVEIVVRPGERDPFQCAFVLGAMGRREHLSLIVPVLLPHLRDNYIQHDAVMSMEALQGLGVEVIPYLEAALPVADVQQRGCLKAMLLEFRSPTTTFAQARSRRGQTRVTGKYHAPARSWRFLTSYLTRDRTAGFSPAGR